MPSMITHLHTAEPFVIIDSSTPIPDDPPHQLHNRYPEQQSDEHNSEQAEEYEEATCLSSEEETADIATTTVNSCAGQQCRGQHRQQTGAQAHQTGHAATPAVESSTPVMMVNDGKGVAVDSSRTTRYPVKLKCANKQRKDMWFSSTEKAVAFLKVTKYKFYKALREAGTVGTGWRIDREQPTGKFHPRTGGNANPASATAKHVSDESSSHHSSNSNSTSTSNSNSTSNSTSTSTSSNSSNSSDSSDSDSSSDGVKIAEWAHVPLEQLSWQRLSKQFGRNGNYAGTIIKVFKDTDEVQVQFDDGEQYRLSREEAVACCKRMNPEFTRGALGAQDAPATADDAAPQYYQFDNVVKRRQSGARMVLVCKVVGCKTLSRCRGLCKMHQNAMEEPPGSVQATISIDVVDAATGKITSVSSRTSALRPVSKILLSNR